MNSSTTIDTSYLKALGKKHMQVIVKKYVSNVFVYAISMAQVV